MRALGLLFLPLLLAVAGCGAKVVCGPGTAALNGACVPNAAACGPGTTSTMDGCASTALECGPGTHDEGGVCLRDPTGDPKLAATPWSNNVRVGSEDSSGFSPAIAVDSKQRIYVAIGTGGGFLGGPIELWRSEDAMSFTRVFTSGSASTGGVPSSIGLNPAVAVDAMDRVVLVWFNQDFSGSRGLVSAISGDGTSFTQATLAPNASGRTATLSRRPDGNVAATWTDNGGVSMALTSTGSMHFGPPSLIYAFPAGNMMQGALIEGPIAFDRDQHPIVLAEIGTMGGGSGASFVDLVALSVQVASQPVFRIALEETAHYTFQAQGVLVSDASGRFRLLFSNAVSRHVEVFESRSDDGTTFKDPVPQFRDPSNPSQNAPSLAVDDNGGIHALFCDTRTGGWLTYSADAPPGGDFGAPTRVSEVEGIESIGGTMVTLGTAIAVRGGRRYAAWADPRNGVYFSTAPVP